MNTQELKQYIDRVLGNNIRCLLPSYWWKKLFGEVVDNIDSVSKSVDSVSKSTKSSIDGLSTRVSKVEKGNTLLVDITYEELGRKRALGELIPGQSYRITDYECTINDEDPSISVVPNPESIYSEKFCVVVTATSERDLSENATATIASGHYTSLDSRTAWTLKYALGNDPDRFSWARKGYKDYDIVISYESKYGNGIITDKLYWDTYSNKYTTGIGDFKNYYLVNSLDDSTPLSKTTFSYGDTVYFYSIGTIVQAEVIYTSSMKDTGDGVLIECHRSNYTPSLAGTYPFVWDPISRVYKYKTAEGSYDYLFDIGKKDSFSRKERFSIKKGTDTFTAATKISNFDIIAGVPGNPFGYVINWNEELGKYTIGDSYLGSSETDSTPLPKGSISVGDMIYIYDSEGLVEYDQIFFVNSLVPEDNVLLDYLQGLVCIIFTWDSQEKIYSFTEGTLVLEDGTPIGKDFDFSSNVQYGFMSIRYTSSSLGDYGLAVGFHVPEGKGVIYYMKDEYNNEAFYDFKNLRFSFPGKSPKKSFSSSKYCFGISIRQSTRENKFILNKVVLDLPSNLLEHPKNVVISGDVYNKLITNYKDNSYIGLDSNGELITKNIFDDTVEILKQEVIDNEEVTAAALNDLNKRLLGKHESLIDGVTIKTFNGKSLLGEGDITFDNYFSTTSTNALQNKVITGAIANLQYKSGVFEHGFESQYEGELGRNPADRYKVLLNYSNLHADATFADILFVRPESTEKRINFVTGMYLDSDNKLHVEYFYKGKCWERVESDSESGFEDIEVSYNE